MTTIGHLISILFLIIIKSNAFSSHWNRVLPRICSDTTPDRVYDSLLDCDQLMDREAREIFDNCVYQVTGTAVRNERPRICYYSENAQQLDKCKSNGYKDRKYSIKQIISKEHKHMWCLMKIARPLGWEQLCVANLSGAKKASIRRCDDSFREITSPISQCYEQVFGQKNDGRPIACRSFESSIQIWQCLERKSQTSNNPNKSRDIEQKANRYMECLKNL